MIVVTGQKFGNNVKTEIKRFSSSTIAPRVIKLWLFTAEKRVKSRLKLHIIITIPVFFMYIIIVD